MHKLDHIVLGALTLEEGTEFVEDILQAKLSDIGYHKDMGTHNRVIRISDDVYLEVVAIDPEIGLNLLISNGSIFPEEKPKLTILPFFLRTLIPF